nr:hypothetical protein [Methylomarinum sp. Ch1-1]MDP4521534.1 hypothetical protein [Methylomarinum sp. Ch1-1]
MIKTITGDGLIGLRKVAVYVTDMLTNSARSDATTGWFWLIGERTFTARDSTRAVDIK